MTSFIQKKLNSYVESIQYTYSTFLFSKIFAGWALLTFLVSFGGFFGEGLLSTYSSLPCFPNFQTCKLLLQIFNLIPLPYSYNEALFFTVLLGLIVIAAYSIYTKKYYVTHSILWILFIIKFCIILANYGSGNYDYYDTAIIFVFLLYPSRDDLVKVTFIILYFLASTIKIHAGWILGTYFSTLYYGLPLVPDALIPVVTNIVIIMQMVGSWLLLSSNKKISTYTLYFFIFFHTYSTVLVGYRYPITSLLSLIVIFMIGNSKDIQKSKSDFKLNKKTTLFYIFIGLLFIGQFIPYSIPGDQKLTLEGNNFGLYMFEANHQCVSTVTAKDGKQTIKSTYDARDRCDPYIYLYDIQKQYCAENDIEVAWTFDHSINGEPFKRIVNTDDVCHLTYQPFIHNTWIKTENEAPVIAKAYKDLYLSRGRSDGVIKKDGYMYSPILSNSSPAQKTVLQNSLEKNIIPLEIFYWTMWFVTLAYILGKIF